MASVAYDADTGGLNMDEINAPTKTTTESPSLDSIIRQCGDLGLYQWIHIFFLNLISMSAGIVAFYYVFGAAEPLHRCQLPSSVWPHDAHYYSVNQTHQDLINTYIPKDKDGKLDKCMRYTTANRSRILVNCPNGWAYDRSVFGYTFTEEADLVCRSEPRKSWLSTLMQTGGFSLVIIGTLGDKFGRKRTTAITTVFLFVLCIMTQICMQWIPMTVNVKFGLLLANQLISGLTVATYSMAFILMIELTSAAHTSLVGNTALTAFTIGEGVLTLFAYLTVDWQKLKWASTAFIGVILPYLYFMPETPLYLYSKRQYTALETVLRQIATRNKRKEIDWYPSYQEFVRNQTLNEVNVESKTSLSKQVRQLFSHKSSIIKLLITCFLGFTTYMLYYEISYGLEVINISPYLGVLIGAVVEAIGYVSGSALIVTRLGRKGTFVIMMSLTAICILIIPFIVKHSAIGTVLVTQLGKYAVSGAIAVSWIFVPELFQTSIRSTANGLFITFSHLGAIIAPVINTSISDEYLPISFYISSALAVVVLLLTLILPETKDKSMDVEQD
ncbi:unnamed protein product [Adineta ricciae]|uniref:Major facilitator superfamily (MFS) profile domain-containing protein n=1 Tax=Adineta ricciae TaxID=249248 RepID=A0A813SSQ6_ADIRI|nr:unnamed protein product [Adineta ricciae]